MGPKFIKGKEIALIWAAFENDIGSCINILNSDKLQVNLCDLKLKTALHYAC